MTVDSADPLPSEAVLALAWSSPEVRGPLSIALQLDQRLARIVARTTEPMLGQMRIAWWREALGKPVEQRPRGDAVLDAIGSHWAGREALLIAMVDAWEVFVTAERLGPAEIETFGSSRGAFFAALGGTRAAGGEARVAAAAFRWAVADAAAAMSNPDERRLLIEAGLARGDRRGPMPPGLRGLALLDSLAIRAMKRDGLPLMEGRAASLAALRAAIFMR